jgi:hypothetical protein
MCMKDHFYIVNKFVCYKYVVMFQQKQIEIFLHAVTAFSPKKKPNEFTNCTYFNLFLCTSSHILLSQIYYI